GMRTTKTGDVPQRKCAPTHACSRRSVVTYRDKVTSGKAARRAVWLRATTHSPFRITHPSGIVPDGFLHVLRSDETPIGFLEHILASWFVVEPPQRIVWIKQRCSLYNASAL